MPLFDPVVMVVSVAVPDDGMDVVVVVDGVDGVVTGEAIVDDVDVDVPVVGDSAGLSLAQAQTLAVNARAVRKVLIRVLPLFGACGAHFRKGGATDAMTRTLREKRTTALRGLPQDRHKRGNASRHASLATDRDAPWSGADRDAAGDLP